MKKNAKTFLNSRVGRKTINKTLKNIYLKTYERILEQYIEGHMP